MAVKVKPHVAMRLKGVHSKGVTRVSSHYFRVLNSVWQDVLNELRQLPSVEERRRWLIENIYVRLRNPKTKIPSFSLPAQMTCPGASRLCHLFCYASKGHYALPAPVRRYVINLLASLLPEFKDHMLKLVERYGTPKKVGKDEVKIFRLHDSGDFYSVRILERELEEMGVLNDIERLLGIKLSKLPDDYYVRVWREIAESNPKLRIYTYTRSWRISNLLQALRKLNALPNVAIFLSIDSTMPEYELKKAFQLSKEFRVAETGNIFADLDAVICPAENRDVRKKRTISCLECGICPFGRKNVIFPLH